MAPPPPNAPPGAFTRAIATATVSNTTPTVLLGSDNARAVTFSIPVGALPTGTAVAIYAGNQAVLEPLLPPPPKQPFFVGAGLSWQAPGGTSPPMVTPASVTINGAGIGPGAFFYQTTTTGMVPMKVTFTSGSVTVPVTTDPGFVITGKPQGYWMVASDGGIFPFGGAVGYGSTGGVHLNAPIVGMTRVPAGNGYWTVASDGGIFPFGNAVGLGSTGWSPLNQPIVGMAATVTDTGYWLVAADGGIFPFGKAQGLGSLGGTHLNRPIVGIAAMT